MPQGHHRKAYSFNPCPFFEISKPVRHIYWLTDCNETRNLASQILRLCSDPYEYREEERLILLHRVVSLCQILLGNETDIDFLSSLPNLKQIGESGNSIPSHIPSELDEYELS